MDQVERYDGLQLLSKDGDPYFLLHDFGEKIIPLGKFKKNLGREKKIKLKACSKLVTNCELERNDSRNVLCRCRLTLCDFPAIIYQIVPYARDSLPIKFFSSGSSKTVASSCSKMHREPMK